MNNIKSKKQIELEIIKKEYEIKKLEVELNYYEENINNSNNSKIWFITN